MLLMGKSQKSDNSYNSNNYSYMGHNITTKINQAQYADY